MNGNSTLSFTLWFTESLLSKCLMKNIEAGTAAPLFSTVGPIWLGHQPKKHRYAAMSISLFSFNFNRKYWW